MGNTRILDLAELSESQPGSDAIYNVTLAWLSWGLVKHVEDRTLTAPPGSESDFQVWIPVATATGAWAGKENQLAMWLNGAYIFKILGAEEDGMVIWDDQAVLFFRWDGSAFQTGPT